MKSDDDRQMLMMSVMSVGESLVRCWRLWSWWRSSDMWFMQSVMGTEGKRAVASNETILSLGPSLNSFIVSTNSNEFLQT